MDNTLKQILDNLEKKGYLGNNRQPVQALSTGKKHTGWLAGRLHFNYQFLINAYTHPHANFDDPIRFIRKEIAVELDNHRFKFKDELISAGQFFLPEVIPFSYEDIAVLEEVLNQLIDHFGLDKNANQILNHYSPEIDYDRKGYILITVLHIPYIS